MRDPDASSGGAPAAAAVPSRREFLSAGAKVCLGAATAAVGAGGLVAAYPAAGEERAVVVERIDVTVGALVLVPGREIFLVRTAEGLGAMSARCTHLGCTLRPMGSGLRCACHGARFDPLGRVLEGPARRDLPWLRLRYRDDGALVLEPHREVPTGTVASSPEPLE